MTAILKNNEWWVVIVALLFFISIKIFLIQILWSDQTIPPEPDDSYTYIGHIYSVIRCQSFLCDYPYLSLQAPVGYSYLSYRIIFGSIAKILNIDPVTIFRLSFYIGIVLLGLVLVFLLRTFTFDNRLVAVSLLFLTFYNGSGAYHGFFWVVPSFFMILFFFLIFSIINQSSKYWLFSLIILTPVFIYIHPLSIYLAFIPFGYAIFLWILTTTWDKNFLKKASAWLLLSIFWHSLQIPFQKYNTNNQVIQNILQQNSFTDTTTTILKRPLSLESLFPGYSMMELNYFYWIFPHWTAIPLFVFCIWILFYFKQHKLLALYFSSLVFVFLLCLHSEGYRGLILLWPVTFILIVFSIWYTAILIRQSIQFVPLRNMLLFGVIFATCGFIAVYGIYAYAWNLDFSRQKRKVPANADYAVYLLDNTSNKDLIHFESKTLHAYSLQTPLIERSIFVGPPVSEIKYYVTFDEASQTNRHHSKLLDSFFDTASLIIKKNRHKILNTSSDIDHIIPNHFVLERDYQDIHIYRNIGH